MKLPRGELWLIAAVVFLIAAEVLLGPVLGIERAANESGELLCLLAAAIACYFCVLCGGATGGRRRRFWRLWAIGFGLAFAGGVLWGAVSHHPSSHSLVSSVTLAFSFVPLVPITAALVLRPGLGEAELRDPFGGYDVGMMVLCWVYLYLYVVVPWQSVVYNESAYWKVFDRLHLFQSGVIAVWLAALAVASRARWRRIYSHLCAAMVLIGTSAREMYYALLSEHWGRAHLFEILLSIGFVWVAATAALAEITGTGEPPPQQVMTLGSGSWLAIGAVLGIPLLAGWSQTFSRAPQSVREFRIIVSFVALLGGVALLYKRLYVADRQREQLVKNLEASVSELRHLQGQFAKAEKLASLGQLAAGAAHEINNPVAAMLGYSELVRADLSTTERCREMGRKIGEQARRIRALVHNLLSLAEQTSRDQLPVDVAALARSAVELRRLGAEHQKAGVRLVVEPESLEVRGDADKLLQVFYGLLASLSETPADRAVDVTIHVLKRGGRVVVEIIQHASDNSSPAATSAVSDAQRAVKGVGLSLTVCFAIVKEHGGTLTAENLPYGGRMFCVELPALTSETAPSPVPATVA